MCLRLTKERRLESRREIDSGESWFQKLSVSVNSGHEPVMQNEESKYASDLKTQAGDEDVDALLDLAGSVSLSLQYTFGRGMSSPPPCWSSRQYKHSQELRMQG